MHFATFALMIGKSPNSMYQMRGLIQESISARRNMTYASAKAILGHSRVSWMIV